jgi:hypothetical protein
MHCCSFEVAVVQSEEIGSWGVESVAEEFEIPDLHLALWAVHSADQVKKQVLVMMNQHKIWCCPPCDPVRYIFLFRSIIPL